MIWDAGGPYPGRGDTPQWKFATDFLKIKGGEKSCAIVSVKQLRSDQGPREPNTVPHPPKSSGKHLYIMY